MILFLRSDSSRQSYWQRLYWCCLLALAACLFTARCAAEDGQSPDRHRIQLAGNTTFSTEQLFDALLAEPDYLLATHPYSEPSDQSDLVKKYLIAGYRQAGFPNVDIDITHTDGGAICRITEGDRFVQRGVSIQGAVEVDHQDLVRRLTTPYPDAGAFSMFFARNGEPATRWVTVDGKESDLNAPVWKDERPVRFDSEIEVGKKITRALSDLGYSQAVAVALFDSDPSSKTTSLVVDIISEGPHDRVDRISIEGNQINDDEQIQRCAGVVTGDRIYHQQLQRYTKRLWETGRFSEQRVRFDPKARELTIQLKEIPDLPPINQPISKMAQSVLAASQWITTSSQRGEDMEVSMSMGDWQARWIQSQGGFFWELTRHDKNNLPKQRVITLLLDSERLLLDHCDHDHHFSVSPLVVDGKLEFTTVIGASEEKDKFAHYGFSFNVSSDREPNEAPIQHSWNISPSDWLPFAYKKNLETQMDGSQLTLTQGDNQIVIDTETGQVVQMAGLANFRFVAGLYAAEKNKILAATKAKPNAFDRAKPISSFASYLVSQPFHQHWNQVIRKAAEDQPADPHLIPAIQKLVDGGLLSGLDAAALMISSHDAEERGSFSIPYRQRERKSFNRMMLELAARFVLRYADRCLAEDGWPMKLTRETCLVIVGRTKYTDRVLNELHTSEEAGPLCYGLMAYGLGYVDRNMAKIFADRALKTMNPEAFYRDFRALTAATDGELVVRTLKSLKTLNEDELNAVAGLGKGKEFAELLRTIHSHPLDESDQSLSDLWYQASKVPLEESLRKILR